MTATAPASLQPRWMRLPLFIQHYGIPRSTLYRLLGAGSITAKKIGRCTYIEVGSAEAFFASAPAPTFASAPAPQAAA